MSSARLGSSSGTGTGAGTNAKPTWASESSGSSARPVAVGRGSSPSPSGTGAKGEAADMAATAAAAAAAPPSACRRALSCSCLAATFCCIALATSSARFLAELSLASACALATISRRRCSRVRGGLSGGVTPGKSASKAILPGSPAPARASAFLVAMLALEASCNRINRSATKCSWSPQEEPFSCSMSSSGRKLYTASSCSIFAKCRCMMSVSRSNVSWLNATLPVGAAQSCNTFSKPSTSSGSTPGPKKGPLYLESVCSPARPANSERTGEKGRSSGTALAIDVVPSSEGRLDARDARDACELLER
mmetsp:Transcript_38040/g.88984  ORF Transcript_38040/g.88984 Transcript_38040/m.88984 type:complete len:307 (-) Transcript_38040:1828-2748(-)